MRDINSGIPFTGLGSGPRWYAIPTDHPLGLVSRSSDPSSNPSGKPAQAATWGNSSLNPSKSSVAQSCSSATKSKSNNSRDQAPRPFLFPSCERDTITLALQLLGKETPRHLNNSSITGASAATGFGGEPPHGEALYMSNYRGSSCRMAAAHSKPAPSVAVGDRCCSPPRAQTPALAAAPAVSGTGHGNRLLVCPHAPARARPPVMLVPAAEMAPYAHLVTH